MPSFQSDRSHLSACIGQNAFKLLWAAIRVGGIKPSLKDNDLLPV